MYMCIYIYMFFIGSTSKNRARGIFEGSDFLSYWKPGPKSGLNKISDHGLDESIRQIRTDDLTVVVDQSLRFL